MSGGFDVEAALDAAGQAEDDAIDVGRTALALAALDRPGVALDRYLDHLDKIAHDVGVAGEEAKTASEFGQALDFIIAGKFSYCGDTLTYDDPQNANLMRVMDRRRGLPVALGVLYMHAGRANGWNVSGLAFPSHFLVRVEHGGERAVLDPFDKGRQLSPADMRALLKRVMGEEAELQPAHWRSVTARDVLLRLQNNIKLRLIRDGRLAEAAAVIDRMLLFAPDQPVLWRESGMVHARIGNLRRATGALETFLQMSASEEERRQAMLALQDLKSRLN